MNIKYFASVNTIEELKKEYRKLSKQYHPDLNKNEDTNKIMSEINNEYEWLFEKLGTEKDFKAGHSVNDSFRSIIDELMKEKYNSVTVEVVGSWIWLSGDTYSVKDGLKEMGFKWSRNNKKWYYAEGLGGKKRGRMSWEDKVKKYGVERVREGKYSKVGMIA